MTATCDAQGCREKITVPKGTDVEWSMAWAGWSVENDSETYCPAHKTGGYPGRG